LVAAKEVTGAVRKISLDQIVEEER